MNKYKSGDMTNIARRNIKKLLAVIAPLYFFALIAAAVAISLANDVYAFKKPFAEAEIAVEEAVNTKEFAEMLSENGIISNKGVFCLYVKSKHAEDYIESFSGELSLSSDMSYREILTALKNKRE